MIDQIFKYFRCLAIAIGIVMLGLSIWSFNRGFDDPPMCGDKVLYEGYDCLENGAFTTYKEAVEKQWEANKQAREHAWEFQVAFPVLTVLFLCDGIWRVVHVRRKQRRLMPGPEPPSGRNSRRVRRPNAPAQRRTGIS